MSQHQLPSVHTMFGTTPRRSGPVPPMACFLTFPPLPPPSQPHSPQYEIHWQSAATTPVEMRPVHSLPQAPRAPSTPSTSSQAPAATTPVEMYPLEPSLQAPGTLSTPSTPRQAPAATTPRQAPAATTPVEMHPLQPSPQAPRRLSTPSMPSTPSTPSTLSQALAERKKKVTITDLDMRARLVKLCINHWAEYVQAKNKKRFFERMRVVFKEKTGLDVNVEGNMNRWPRERKKVMDEIVSGVGRNYNEYEQAIDRWIALIDEYQAKSAVNKKEKKEEEDQRVAEVKKVRETMKHTLAERHRSSDSTPVVDLTTDAETNKRKADTPSKHAPAEFKRRVTDRIMAGMKQDGKEFIAAVEEIEEKKMDRLEEILTKALSGRGQTPSSSAVKERSPRQDEQLEKRVDGLETKVDGIKSTLDRLVLLLENGP